jgi:hypothetical protein
MRGSSDVPKIRADCCSAVIAGRWLGSSAPTLAVGNCAIVGPTT